MVNKQKGKIYRILDGDGSRGINKSGQETNAGDGFEILEVRVGLTEKATVKQRPEGRNRCTWQKSLG